MRPTGKALFGWWAFWSVVALAGVLYVGIRSDWHPGPVKGALIAAGLVSLYVALRCARSWWSTAAYSAIHWWHH